MKPFRAGLVAFAPLILFAASVLASPLKLDKKDIDPKQCSSPGAKQLVDVRFTMINDADSGFNSALAWANDTIERRLRIWERADGSFCAQISDQGGFVTYDGQSPGATNSPLAAGISGRIEGGYVTTDIHGTFAPQRPTRGDLGTFDLMCSQSFDCPGSKPSWKDYFAAGVSANEFAQWGWIYRAGPHGTWLNQDNVDAADSGDITTAAHPRSPGGQPVVYDSTVTPLPANLPSVGAEAYSFAEFGDQVSLAEGGRRLKSVTVTLSSWACQSGHWFSADCVSAPHATFAVPITLNIYSPDDPTHPIATQTKTFNVPYRPSTDAVRCTGGRWFDKKRGCFNGLANNIRFDFAPDVVLPDTIVWGISYDTTHYGPNPIGESAACFTGSGGCPYDSLNIALSPLVRTGSKPNPDTVWQNAAFSGDYCDDGAAGVGVFRLDSPSSACWGGYIPAARFTTVK